MWCNCHTNCIVTNNFKHIINQNTSNSIIKYYYEYKQPFFKNCIVQVLSNDNFVSKRWYEDGRFIKIIVKNIVVSI